MKPIMLLFLLRFFNRKVVCKVRLTTMNVILTALESDFDFDFRPYCTCYNRSF